MERIASLIIQLSDLLQKGASENELLSAANELQVLLQEKALANSLPEKGKRIAMLVPGGEQFVVTGKKEEANNDKEQLQATDEKVFEVLQVDEEELEAELAEIRKKAEFTQQLQAKQSLMKPGILFDFDEEEEAHSVPTLIHQKKNQKSPSAAPAEREQNEEKEDVSLNEKHKEESKDIVHFLEQVPIKDLKKAIGINDRYQYINELFRGDADMYERSIKTINNFSAYGEAHYWIERELKVKVGWDMSRQITKDFYALVKRRFS
jgi:hypothetical protein